MTLVLINKSAAPLSAALTIFAANGVASSQLSAGSAVHRYQYSAASLNAITQLPDLQLTNGLLIADFPANSITLAVIPATTLPTEPAAKVYLPLVSR